MTNYNLPLFQNKPEVWDKKKCEKTAKHIAKDGLGTKYGFKGYIGCHYGDHRYNGGNVFEGKWYQGENKPFPVIHKDFEIVRKPSWGWVIQKKESA